MQATIETLRAITRKCLNNHDDQLRWLGRSLEEFLAHRCRSVDEALGLRFRRSPGRYVRVLFATPALHGVSTAAAVSCPRTMRAATMSACGGLSPPGRRCRSASGNCGTSCSATYRQTTDPSLVRGGEDAGVPWAPRRFARLTRGP